MIATLFFLVFLLINQMQHPKIPQCKIEYNLRLFLLAHNKDYGFMSNSKQKITKAKKKCCVAYFQDKNCCRRWGAFSSEKCFSFLINLVSVSFLFVFFCLFNSCFCFFFFFFHVFFDVSLVSCISDNQRAVWSLRLHCQAPFSTTLSHHHHSPDHSVRKRLKLSSEK